jgi:hypothetical protein
MSTKFRLILLATVFLLLTVVTAIGVFAFDAVLEGQGSRFEQFSLTNKIQFNSAKDVRFAGFNFSTLPPGFKAYAPDGFSSTVPYTPFSAVEDWSKLLGANANDSSMQLIGNSVISVTIVMSQTDGVYFMWQNNTPTPTMTNTPTTTPTATPTAVPTIMPTKTLTTTWEWVITPGDTAQVITSTQNMTNTHAFYSVNARARFAGHFTYQAVGAQCKMYVPDQFAQQYPNAIKFSDVKDWSFDTMFGATEEDSLPQLICDFGKSVSAVVLKTQQDIILLATRLRKFFLPLVNR